MSKKITIELSGKELVLNFGIGRFYEEFKSCTGEDLITLAQGFDSSKLISIVKGLVWAGYFSECKKERKQLLFTKEEVFELVSDCETDWIAQTFKKYTDTIQSNGVAPGEVVSQLENQQL